MMRILLIFLASFISCTVGQTCAGLQGQEKGCYFNGRYYEVGSMIKEICFDLTCVKTEMGLRWNYTIDNPSCAWCRARDDPHFDTFDSHRYDWHGLCNYTLSQPFQCPSNCSYYPKYGVYSDFYSCNSNTASCVGESTYKINANTVVKIIHSTLLQVFVNGYAITVPPTPTLVCNVPQPTDVHPLIVWRAGAGCLNLQGIDFSIRACDNSITIYTTRNHSKLLDGLCGFYTGKVEDEFLTRDCDPLSLDSSNILPFANSWITLQQKDDGECCPKEEDKIRYKTKCDDKIFRDSCIKALNEIKVRNEIERKSLIDDCVSDCCRSPKDCEKVWIPNAKKLAQRVATFGE